MLFLTFTAYNNNFFTQRIDPESQFKFIFFRFLRSEVYFNLHSFILFHIFLCVVVHEQFSHIKLFKVHPVYWRLIKNVHPVSVRLVKVLIVQCLSKIIYRSTRHSIVGTVCSFHAPYKKCGRFLHVSCATLYLSIYLLN